jgi:signal transduction histidine kinase
MTADQLARLGERFFRADASGSVPGTGLGVAFSQKVIALHGGCLEATSELGKGSCLTVWLPSAAPAGELRDERAA